MRLYLPTWLQHIRNDNLRYIMAYELSCRSLENKARVEITGQTSKRKYFLGDFLIADLQKL